MCYSGSVTHLRSTSARPSVGETKPSPTVPSVLFSDSVMSTAGMKPSLVLLFSGKRKSGKDYITDLLKVKEMLIYQLKKVAMNTL